MLILGIDYVDRTMFTLVVFGCERKFQKQVIILSVIYIIEDKNES